MNKTDMALATCSFHCSRKTSQRQKAQGQNGRTEKGRRVVTLPWETQPTSGNHHGRPEGIPRETTKTQKKQAGKPGRDGRTAAGDMKQE